MARVNLNIDVHIGRGDMRDLNPYLKRKGLTIQEAVERGLKDDFFVWGVNFLACHAARKGAGMKVIKKRRMP